MRIVKLGSPLLALSLVALSAVAAEPARIFRAGAAMSNLTPPLGISLEGVIGGQGAVARHIHDELHARCLVLDDGTERIAIVICDATMISRDVHDRAKQIIQDESGLAPNRVLTAATHSHSTPRPLNYLPAVAHSGYLEFVARRIADGVRRAINHLAPARIGWGAGHKPEFLFNRRWLMQPGSKLPNPFGETSDQVQMNPPRGSPNLLRPAGGIDPELMIVSVQHADGRPLALLANYGLHYIGGTGPGTVSADYFGAFADRIQELLQAGRQDPPFVGIMSNGTSGDVNGIDFRKAEASEPPYARIRAVADGVAAEAHRVWKTIAHRSDIRLAMEESELELGLRRPSPERVQWARRVAAEPKSLARVTQRDIYAREALALAELPPTVKIKLQALRIGDLGIVAAPCEVFVATGLQIKAGTSLAKTFTISLANGYDGYLPTPRDHELGGYETWPARSSYLEVQASEKIRDELLRLLKSVTERK